MSTPGNRKVHQDVAEQRAEQILHRCSLTSVLLFGGNTDGIASHIKFVSVSKQTVGVSRW